MAPAMKASAPIEALAGVVERVTFHNGENGFCVLRVKAQSLDCIQPHRVGDLHAGFCLRHLRGHDHAAGDPDLDQGIVDVYQSNGVIQVVDRVLLPN